MRSYNEATEAWEATFTNNTNLSDLRAAVQDISVHNPCVSGLRSVCWKAFLLFESLDRSTWQKVLLDSRSAYSALRDHFLKDIEHADDLSAVDPLADDENSPWNRLRRDEDLRAEIFQDVERCMPDNVYFREPSTQSQLLDILFIFCKLNRDVGYRQGMHEVLAPVLWVVSRDSIDPGSFDTNSEYQSGQDGLLRSALDADFIEHDAFTLFAIIMQTVKSFYEMGSNDQPAISSTPSSSPIVERSKRIHEYYLRLADPELAEHLTEIEILPQIFLIRWIRLLFGREFPFEEVLSLWDVLFAADPALELVDFVCVGMLLRIRWQLIEADYSAALTLLLRYPVPVIPYGPPSFVGDALYLRENILLDGGVHIISKHSGKAPASLSEIHADPKSKSSKSRFSRKNKQAKSVRQEVPSKIISPIISPSKFLQEQGGIEGIIQEAARGVYTRGEKWGVGKAFRGAIQGLQSGDISPRRLPDASRWSLDYGKSIPGTAAHLTAKIQALEERNKGLAKMLENAMESLWVQQREFAKGKTESAADALSLAIAKVQFVQVYLEDSTMSLPSDALAHGATKLIEDTLPAPEDQLESHETVEAPSQAQGPSPDEASKSNPSPKTVSAEPDLSDQSPCSPAQVSFKATTLPSNSTIQAPLASAPSSQTHRPGPSRFQHPRPSLAQSSFSWMLGEDQRKSSFISPSPFPSEKRKGSTARDKAGFLFGDEKLEGKGPTLGKGRDGNGEESASEGFTLGTLRGRKEGR